MQTVVSRQRVAENGIVAGAAVDAVIGNGGDKRRAIGFIAVPLEACRIILPVDLGMGGEGQGQQ